MWRLSCAGATAGAVSALALGFASPARADGDPAGSPAAPATAAAAPAAPVPPTPPVVVTQVAPANVNVDIRIGSPGDNGSVAQTIATTAAAAGAPPADTGSAAANTGGASTTQTAPSNVNVSIRVQSPGSDGAVAQQDASGAAGTQYQTPTGQYQGASAPQAAPAPPVAGPDAAPATSSAAPASAIQSADPTAVIAPPPSSTAVAPATWTWNWTWCGDIAVPSITAPTDIGIQGWVWNWNLGGSCATSSQAPLNIGTEISTQIADGAAIQPIAAPAAPAIAPPAPPIVPAPLAPVAPTWPVVIAPTPPEIVPPAPPDLGGLPVPPSLVPTLDPSAPPAGAAGNGTGPPFNPSAGEPQQKAQTETAAAQAIPATRTSAVAAEQPTRTASGATVSRPQTDMPFHLIAADLGLFGSAPGSAAASGGGSAAAGAAAAAAIWLIFLLPGFTLRRTLPSGRRVPRSRAGDVLQRPG